MALATRPKPKVQHRKRVAQHHKQTSHYLKVYGPYLPVFVVVGGGIAANKLLDETSGLYTAASLNGLGNATRIEAMAGQHSGFALALVIAIAGLAMAILLFYHWFRIQRALNRGEAFIAHHPWIDVALVMLITAGVLLTRQAI
jgi:uncharacterized membrane protein YidH (DUF202 family)